MNTVTPFKSRTCNLSFDTMIRVLKTSKRVTGIPKGLCFSCTSTLGDSHSVDLFLLSNGCWKDATQGQRPSLSVATSSEILSTPSTKPSTVALPRSQFKQILTFSDILCMLDAKIDRSDQCDEQTPICPPPASPVKPPLANPVKLPRASDGDRTSHIRRAYILDFRNPLHCDCRLVIQWSDAGRVWRDHLTGLPMQFGSGPLACTRIAHRVHGLPFCWGFDRPLPTSRAHFSDIACNTIVELRSTKWWGGAYHGAALLDSLNRWVGLAGVFSAAARGREEASFRALALTEDEAACFSAATAGRTVTFGARADPLLLVNSYHPTEQAAWRRRVFGPRSVDRAADLVLPPGLTKAERMFFRRMSQLRAQSADLLSHAALHFQRLLIARKCDQIRAATFTILGLCGGTQAFWSALDWAPSKEMQSMAT